MGVTMAETTGVENAGEHHGDVVVPTVVVSRVKPTSFEATGVGTTVALCHPHCLCQPQHIALPSPRCYHSQQPCAHASQISAAILE